MTEASIVAQCMIYNHMISNDLQPQTLSMTKGLLQSFEAARSWYHKNLNEKRKDNILNEQDRKCVSIQRDIVLMMNVKKDLETICACLTNDFESLMEKTKIGKHCLCCWSRCCKTKKKWKNRVDKKVGRKTGMFSKNGKKYLKENS